MNKALIVGIDHYDMIGSLHGAVNDAYAVKTVLERHADGTLNFAHLCEASSPIGFELSGKVATFHRTWLPSIPAGHLREQLARGQKS